MDKELAIDQLQKNGYKITPQRQEILETFMGYEGNLLQSAEDIYRKVVERCPNISLDTVYRNLNVLQELEIINKLILQDGKSRYELNSGKHYHHLICLKCGAAEAIDFCPFELLDREKIEAEKRFEIRKHSFEVFGYCNLCRKKPPEKHLTECGCDKGTVLLSHK